MAQTTPAPPHPADVELRVIAFRAQLEARRQAGASSVLLLRLPEAAAVPVTAGVCAGGGAPLEAARTWRGTMCVTAVETVLGLPPVRLDPEAAR